MTFIMKFQKTVSLTLIMLFVTTVVHITKNMVGDSDRADGAYRAESHNSYRKKLMVKAPDLFILINNAKKNSLKSALATAVASTGNSHADLKRKLGLGGEEAVSQGVSYPNDNSWLQNDVPTSMSQAPQTHDVFDMVVRDILLLPIGTPVNGGILTSGYGVRNSPFSGLPATHLAIDIAAKNGTAVKVTAPGIVIATGDSSSLGLFVVVKHSSGIVTKYGHLSDITVEEGDSIKRGKVIGSVGSTGRSTGPHLHYEIGIAGRRINPIYFVRLAKEIEEILQQEA